MGLEHRNIVPSVVVGCLSLSARSLLSALCAGCIIKLYTKKCEQIEGVWRICKKNQTAQILPVCQEDISSWSTFWPDAGIGYYRFAYTSGPKPPNQIQPTHQPPRTLSYWLVGGSSWVLMFSSARPPSCWSLARCRGLGKCGDGLHAVNAEQNRKQYKNNTRTNCN